MQSDLLLALCGKFQSFRASRTGANALLSVARIAAADDLAALIAWLALTHASGQSAVAVQSLAINCIFTSAIGVMRRHGIYRHPPP
ncbi:hypothetical protein JJQ59_34850 (plasmid) [Cupriavidus necator]|uniref:hypothetical protein n=1 Tax=Cupriavidus necator TaxID=106590 RepID=UPI0011BECC57|nr:hypothetical protein [Cupriavidus necator]QQX89711.1 hypothetical protein JJQ59_34850 [Cupriavidus necator]